MILTVRNLDVGGQVGEHRGLRNHRSERPPQVKEDVEKNAPLSLSGGGASLPGKIFLSIVF